MTKEQAVRVQREIVPGSRCVPNGDPFLTYGIWVLPFSHSGVGLTVYLVDRSIVSESDHNKAKEEAIQKLAEAIGRPDML